MSETRRPMLRRVLLAYAHPGAGRAWGIVALGLLLDLLALPPGPFPFAIFLADVPLLWLLGGAVGTRWRRWAWLYGALHFGLALRWLVEVHPVQVVGAAVGLSFVTLLAAGAIRAVVRRGVAFGLAVPTVLVLEELLRTVWLGGMPWPARSLSFAAFPAGLAEPFVASCAFLGAYALSFVAAGVSAGVAGLVPAWCLGRTTAQKSAGTLFVAALALLGLGLCGAARLDATVASGGLETTGRRTLVAVQASIPQSLKHSLAEGVPQEIFRRHVSLTREALEAEAARGREPFAVLWPETMIPWVFPSTELAHRFPDEWENQLRVLGHVRAVAEIGEDVPRFLLGAICHYRRGDERHEYIHLYGTHDSLFLVDPLLVPDPRDDPPPPPPLGETPGWLLGRHDKRVLVPGGEYTPMGEWLPPLRWFRNLVAVIPELDPGADLQRPFDVGPRADEIPAGTVICFELFFPARCRAWRSEGAQVLLNAANYGWFGPTGFRAQARAAAALRAAETACAVVMAGNTGPTAFFDPRGRPYGRFETPVSSPADGGDDESLPAGGDETTFREGWARGPLVTDPDTTPYVRWGDLPWLALGATLLGFALVVGGRRAPGSRPPGTASEGENL